MAALIIMEGEGGAEGCRESWLLSCITWEVHAYLVDVIEREYIVSLIA